MRKGRRQTWLLALAAGVLALLYGTNFAGIRLVSGTDPDAFIRTYPAYFGLLFLVYVASVRLTWDAGRRVARAVILLGVAFRLFMLFTPVALSTDLYRYLWDGRVQLAGINPYRYSPDAPELAGLRDPEVHPKINRPWARTIYPPGDQMTFAALAWIAPDRIWALRAFLIACETATMLLLACLLRRLGLPEGRIAVYAWAPLPIFEFAQAGHIDAAMIPLVLGALLAAGRGRRGLAGGLLGGAFLIKLYPAILAPVLWRRSGARFALAFLATAVLGYAPYAWGAGWKVVGYLPTYFARYEEFNVGLRALLTDRIGLPGPWPRLAVSGLLLAVLLAVLLGLGRKGATTLRDLTRASGAAVGAYLLLLPSTIQPWYVAWLAPFLAVLPGPGWWYLTAAVPLSYLAYAGGPVRVPTWALAIEYLPACLAVLVGLYRARREPEVVLPAVEPKALGEGEGASLRAFSTSDPTDRRSCPS